MTDIIEAMKPCLQYGKAYRWTKREDRVFTFELASGDALLVGVADGLSSANGGAAAEWIYQTMHDIANAAAEEIFSARELFKRVEDALARAEHGAEARDSLSTLSCGICELKYAGNTPVLHFDFFGVGDSPIWRVVPLAPPDELRFQANVVYDSPTPREQGVVYSFVSLLDRKIEGRPHFGSVELAEDELLIVASDGVPEWRIFGEDQDPKHNGDSPKLIDRLFEAPSITDDLLNETLLEYDRRGMLIDDDASIAVVRWRYPREVLSQPEEEHIAEPAREDVRSAIAPEPMVSSALGPLVPAASSTGRIEVEILREGKGEPLLSEEDLKQIIKRNGPPRQSPANPGAGAAGSSKRAQTKLENRRAILTAAREVFAEVGYEAASVRDIIGRTGLASGTFYNYYRSKEEIARAIASDAAERLRPILRAHREGATDFGGYLIGVIRVYFQFIVDEQLALRTTRQLAERYPRVRVQTPAVAAVFEEVRSSIEFVMQRDPGLRVDVEYLTAAVIGVAREIGERMLARRPLDIDGAAAFAANLILRGLPTVPRGEP